MIKKILTGIMLIVLLSACNNNDNGASEAKQELLSGNENTKLENEIMDIDDDSVLSETDVTNISNEPVNVTNLIGEGLLEFHKISASNLAMGKITISGVADSDIQKIVVSFHNDESEMPDDSHELSEYSKTKPNFRYNAYPEFDVFDFGMNVYTFTAYDDNGGVIAQTRISIEYTGDDTSYPVDISQDVNLEEVRFDEGNISLPASETYGQPVVTSTNISYSNIENFEIRSYADISGFTCDNATDILLNMDLGYFYWNTCRALTEDTSSVYVVKKTGDSTYGYYKYYFNTDKGLVGYVLLENGDLELPSEGVATDTTPDGENLDDESSENNEDNVSSALRIKNDELKQKNSTYSASQITDSLMKNID